MSLAREGDTQHRGFSLGCQRSRLTPAHRPVPVPMGTPRPGHAPRRAPALAGQGLGASTHPLSSFTCLALLRGRCWDPRADGHRPAPSSASGTRAAPPATAGPRCFSSPSRSSRCQLASPSGPMASREAAHPRHVSSRGKPSELRSRLRTSSRWDQGAGPCHVRFSRRGPAGLCDGASPAPTTGNVHGLPLVLPIARRQHLPLRLRLAPATSLRCR